MTKTAPVIRRKNSLKPPAARKRSSPPFADKIPFIRSLILDSVKPGTIKKIYLFGSYAYGRPTKKSDIDLCVIIRNNLDDTKAYMKIALSLYDNDIIPADILVYKEKEFIDFTNPNSNFTNPGSVENIILTKGKILYE